MKLAMIVMLGILLLGSFSSMQADQKAAGPAGASQAVIAFSGASVYTSDTTGICMFYPLLFADLNLESLFAPLPTWAVDKEHAYLIWVSDFSVVPLTPYLLKPSSNRSFTLQLIATGTATIYFSDRPDTRDWRDWAKRSTWGEPVATLVRRGGIFQSTDGGMSGTMAMSVDLVSSKPFQLNGKTVDFKDLIPHGMTCFETGVGWDTFDGEDEAGTCVANGSGQ
jgi:hypothetical protein